MASFERKRESTRSFPSLSAKHLSGAQLLPSRHTLLERLPHKGTIAELGVDEGDFSAQILKVCSPHKLHLVDSWGSATYDKSKQDSVYARFVTPQQLGTVEINLGRSTNVAEQFEDSYFDWIYIDTDHSYAVTKAELLAYHKKIKPGGYLAGHDYILGNWTHRIRYGVKEAVHEFCIEHDWKIVYLTMECPGYPSFALQRIGA